MTLKGLAKLSFAISLTLTLAIIILISLGLSFLNRITKSGLIGYGGLIFLCTLTIFLAKTTFKSKFFLILLSVLIPYAGAVFAFYYLIFKVENKDEKNRNVDLWVEKRDFLTDGKNQTTYFYKAADAWTDFLTELRKAKEEVLIFSYIFESGKASSGLVTVIHDLLKRGVKVKLGVDYYGSGNVKSCEEFKALRSRGMDVFVTNKPFAIFLPKHQIRTHAKVYIIDKKICYLPSFNITDQSVFRDKNCCVKIKGNIGFAYNAFFPLFGVEKIEEKPDESILAVLSKGKEAENLYVAALNKSRKTVKIVTPYLSFGGRVYDAIKRAIRRGVLITIVIPPTDKLPKLDAVSLRSARILREEGVSINEYKGEFLHCKMIIVDDFLSITGSLNFDERSAVSAVESFIISVDNGLIGGLLEDFDQIKLSSYPFLAARLGKTKIFDKILGVFSPLV